MRGTPWAVPVFRPADDCRKKWTVQLEATYTTELGTTWEKAIKSIRLLVFTLVLVVIALMLSSTVYAHHPYSDFDNEKTKIEGKVVQYLFVNPNRRLQVEDGQKQRWDVEWASRELLPLRMRGFRQDSLRYGDTVIITGNPTRDPADHRLKVQTLRRSDGSFTWGK